MQHEAAIGVTFDPDAPPPSHSPLSDIVGNTTMGGVSEASPVDGSPSPASLTLLEPPYNPYALTTTVGTRGLGTEGGTTPRSVQQEQVEEEDEEEEEVGSSISARSEMEVLEKHVQSLLNPHDVRDMVLRAIGCVVISILLIVLIVTVSDLGDRNEAIRVSGPRVVLPAHCIEPIPIFTISSWGISDALHGPISVTVSPADTIPLSPFTLGSIMGTSELPPLPSKNIVILSSDTLRGEVSLAVVSHGVQGAQYRYTLPLTHTKIVGFKAHGVKQHSGEWDVLLVYKQNVSLEAVTVAMRVDGNVNMNTAVVVDDNYGEMEVVEVVYLNELPLRYVVLSQGLGGVCEYTVLEASSSSHVSILFSKTSSHILCGSTESVATTPLGPTTFFVASQRGLMYVEVTATGLVEWAGAAVPCPTPVLSTLDDASVVAMCQGGVSYLIEASSRSIQVLPTHSAPPSPGYTPLAGYVSGRDEVLLLGSQQDSTVYVMHKIVRIDGGVYTSDMVRLPSVHTTHPTLGVFASILTLFNPVTEEIQFYPLAWNGGLRAAGLTLSPCQQNGGTTLLIQGVVSIPEVEAAGHTLRSSEDGSLTTDPNAVGVRTMGLALDKETAYFDIIRG